MSNTRQDVYHKLIELGFQLHPDSGFDMIARLWHPTKDISAAQFVQELTPFIQFYKSLGYKKLQLWNEPNHVHGVEGPFTAQTFHTWSRESAQRILDIWSEVELIYAPMACPLDGHKDGKAWISEAHDTILQYFKGGVGAHCYWQNIPGVSSGMHLNGAFGQAYLQVAEVAPAGVDIHVLEAGNSNHQNGHAQDFNVITDEIRELIPHARNHPQVKTFSPFILSSPDSTWSPFSWIDENGVIRPMANVYA